MLTKYFKKTKSIISENVYRITKSILLQSYALDKLFPSVKKLHPIPPETVATPEFKQIENEGLVFNKAIHTDSYSLPDIYTAHLHEVIYYPKYDMIFTNSGKIIKETISTIYYLNPYQILDLVQKINIKFTHLFPEMSKPEKLSGNYSIISQFGRQNNYYHTVTDIIPRLYLLNQTEYQNIDEIKLLFSREPTTLERFFIEKLAPKNIKITVVENPHRLYSVARLIFPTLMTSPARGYLPSEYLEYFREKVLPKRASKRVNRIFISRAKANRRRMINEDELFEALKPYGFKKYFLEDMSVETQIGLFYDADCVVGSHGAGLTNIIFSRSIKVLELFGDDFFRSHYYYMAKSLRHTYGYCPGTKKKSMRKHITPSIRAEDAKIDVPKVIERLIELEKRHKQISC